MARLRRNRTGRENQRRGNGNHSARCPREKPTITGHPFAPNFLRFLRQAAFPPDLDEAGCRRHLETSLLAVKALGRMPDDWHQCRAAATIVAYMSGRTSSASEHVAKQTLAEARAKGLDIAEHYEVMRASFEWGRRYPLTESQVVEVLNCPMNELWPE